MIRLRILTFWLLFEMTDVLQASDLLGRLADATQRRDSEVLEVRCVRRYILHNPHWTTDGIADALFIIDGSGRKRYQILSMTAQGLQKQILKHILDGELEASEKKENEFTPAHYETKPIGTKVINGRQCQAVELIPKKRSRFLLEGWGCIDTTDFALVHVEGRTSASVSFWVGRPYLIQDFRKVGQFWYSAMSQSNAEVRFLGKTELTIEFLDYSIAPKNGPTLIACASLHCSAHLSDRPPAAQAEAKQ